MERDDKDIKAQRIGPPISPEPRQARQAGRKKEKMRRGVPLQEILSPEVIERLWAMVGGRTIGVLDSQIFPPGEGWERGPNPLPSRGTSRTGPRSEAQLVIRILFGEPKSWWVGTEGFRGYVIGVYHNFVAAEHPEWGNALYIVPVEGWVGTVLLPRLEARRMGAVPVIHLGDWEERARRVSNNPPQRPA